MKYVLIDEIIIISNIIIICLIIEFVSLITLVISTIILFFIHSQYSSIYDKMCLTNAIRNTIYILINSQHQNKLKKVNELIDQEYKKFKKQLHPSEGNHMIHILKGFWVYRLSNNEPTKKLLTHQTQEALLYSIIIILYIAFFLSGRFLIWINILNI